MRAPLVNLRQERETARVSSHAPKAIRSAQAANLYRTLTNIWRS
jgi:hypothetical protein